jgi:hypothetical protein
LQNRSLHAPESPSLTDGAQFFERTVSTEWKRFPKWRGGGAISGCAAEDGEPGQLPNSLIQLAKGAAFAKAGFACRSKQS